MHKPSVQQSTKKSLARTNGVKSTPKVLKQSKQSFGVKRKVTKLSTNESNDTNMMNSTMATLNNENLTTSNLSSNELSSPLSISISPLSTLQSTGISNQPLFGQSQRQYSTLTSNLTSQHILSPSTTRFKIKSHGIKNKKLSKLKNKIHHQQHALLSTFSNTKLQSTLLSTKLTPLSQQSLRQQPIQVYTQNKKMLSTTNENPDATPTSYGFDGGLSSKVGQDAPSMDPDELQKLLKQFESMEEDPYDIARTNPPKWKETPTPDGWVPGENDQTFIMPDPIGSEHTKPEVRHRVDTEITKGPTKKLAFQTETAQMLDIVTNSLYTDKEVFLRELVSNGSDALEKARFLATRHQLLDSDIPLEIRIFVDETNKTITLQDTGIGMTHDELISHLGTIARSGSKQWVREMKTQTSTDDIIGQFGVGFYSAFMVGSKLEVYSRTGKKTPQSGKTKSDDGSIPQDPDESTFTEEELTKHRQGHYWTSTGTGEYEISECDGVERGTKIVIHLRDNAGHFGTRQALEAILKKYSNFVGFPIYLNGLRVNTIQAIWNMNRNEVTEEQHAEFYRYLANAYDKPVYRMHFNADVPLQINALFYFPERHMEKFGMGRMDPGTSLYSRKVLIKPKAKGLLPEYLRFVQGVVDSEDIPLNISRENMQDSLLISRISSVLTKRVIKHLQDEAKKNPSQYVTWFNEFGSFIREGICSDFTHKTELARLLRFDSSDPSVSPDTPTSLDDYISRMPPDQTQIYYLNAPNRKAALESPYYEHIKSSGYEVLFLYHPLDDFAMQNLREFNRRKLCSAESQSVETSVHQQQKQLQLEQEYADLAAYIKGVLSDKVTTVTITDQVSKYPAYIVDHESSSMRKMMKMMDTQSMFGNEGAAPIPKQKLHVNPKHPIMTKLSIIKDKQPSVAKAVLEQVFDNALMAADLLDNPRDMLPRMQNILEMALDPTLVQQFENDKKM